MKNYILPLFLTFLLIPSLSSGQVEKTIEIQGVIGDSAPQSRTYEVEGKIYELDQDIAIQTEAGEALSFANLKGGVEIKIIAERTTEPKPKDRKKIRYIKIIVLNR